MNKLLRVLKSRFFLSALVIIIEFILLLLVFILLYNHFSLMVIMSYIFYIGVFLYIINKYKNPELKLPWIIILLLLSVVGAYIFVILVGSEDLKKASKKYHQVKAKLKLDLTKNNNLDALKEENMDAYLQAKYICNTTDLPCSNNSLVTYYSRGEDFYQDLLNELRQAKKFIFMEYFIIEAGIMWNSIYEILKEKAQQGVKIYVLYDDFGCLKTLDENYYQELNKVGINSLPSNKFRPVLSSFHNNRDHRKITVIDGTIGFTGGINLADEYINEKVKFGHWRDSAIKIEGEGVKNLTVLFLEIWNIQTKEELKLNDFINFDYNSETKEGMIIPYGAGPESFYEHNVGKNIYLNMINTAKKSIYITTPYLICDYEILNSLCIAAQKRIDVKIIVPHIPDKKPVFLITQSNYEQLVKNGVKIYEYTPGFIHAKNFICDDLYATCGTINLDYRSLVHHFECGAWMYNTNCIKDMTKDFNETLKLSQEITLEKAKLKGWKKLLAELMKVFSPIF